MAKAMLIISSCSECPYVDDLGHIRVCNRTGENIVGYTVRRQDNCPLREVPQKKKMPNIWGQGYNACIDEILGGGE